MKLHRTIKTVGIVGYGAFGKLIARHLHQYFDIKIYDPAIPAKVGAAIGPIKVVDKRSAASCDVVVLAVPVASIEDVIRKLLPYLASDGIEPPRICRRPQLVRSRVYDKQNDEQIFC